MMSFGSSLLKIFVFLSFSLLMSALMSTTANAAEKLVDLDPQGDRVLELLAQDLQITQSPALTSPQLEQSFQKDGRDYYQLQFSHPSVKIVRLMISGPKGFLAGVKKYPVLFISAGFFVGMSSIGLVDNPGDLVLVGFEYPSTMDQIKKDPALLFKTIRIVPGQMAFSLEWIKSQAWASDKVSVMGVSLGSLFMPSGLRLAELRGFVPSSTIFAFGGAHIVPVVEKKLLNELNPLALKLALNFIANLTSLHDPKLHLPSLHGPFLTIYGTQDEVFPRESSLLQYELLQGEKEIHWVNGSHIDTNKPEVIKDTMTKVLEFLRYTNFFN